MGSGGTLVLVLAAGAVGMIEVCVCVLPSHAPSRKAIRNQNEENQDFTETPPSLYH